MLADVLLEQVNLSRGWNGVGQGRLGRVEGGGKNEMVMVENEGGSCLRGGRFGNGGVH